MAGVLRQNPTTGEWEEDGVPVAAPTPGAVPSTPAPNAPPVGGQPPALPGQLQVIQPPAETFRTERSSPTETVTGPTPEGRQRIDAAAAANEERKSALVREQDGQEAAGRVEAVGAGMQGNVAEISAIQRELAQREHAQKVHVAMAAREKARKQVEATANPTTFWEDRGMPARILAAFLVGLSSPKSGVWEMLQAGIAQDRQAKLDRYVRSKEFLQMQEQNIEGAKEALADKLAEINGKEISKIRSIVKQVEGLSKRVGIPAARAAAEALNAKAELDIQMRLAKEEGHVTRTTGRQSSSHTVNTPSGGVAGPGARPDPLQVPGWDGGVVGRAATPQEAIKLRDAHAASHSLLDLVDQLDAHIKENGVILNPFTQGQEKQRRDGIMSQMAGKLTVANQTGTLQAGEYERYKAMATPNFWQALKPSDLGSALRDLKADAKRGYERMIKAQGLAPAAAEPAAPAASPAAAAATPAKKGRETKVLKSGKRAFRINGGEWRILD